MTTEQLPRHYSPIKEAIKEYKKTVPDSEIQIQKNIDQLKEMNSKHYTSIREYILHNNISSVRSLMRPETPEDPAVYVVAEFKDASRGSLGGLEISLETKREGINTTTVHPFGRIMGEEIGFTGHFEVRAVVNGNDNKPESYHKAEDIADGDNTYWEASEALAHLASSIQPENPEK